MSPVTVSRLVTALEMDKQWVDSFVSGSPAPDSSPKNPQTAEEKEKQEQTAQRLTDKIHKDPTAPPVAEALLTTLAYEFAGGHYLDLHTAYTALRQALEAAENIRKRGEMPPDNTGSQLNAVMAEVAKLNDKGETEDADALLDAEEARRREERAAERDRMEQDAQAWLTERINQDRLRNRPDLAAERIVRNLREFPKGKLFWAVDDTADKWKNQGDKAGDIFALEVALALAQDNYNRAKTKKPLAANALKTLGWCRLRLAERSSEGHHLINAHRALRAAVQKTSKTKAPQNWSARQDGLGGVLREMGKRERNKDLLKNAVSAHRAALKLDQKSDSDYVKHRWNNLGIALQELGEVTEDADILREAEATLTEALALKEKDQDHDLLDWEMSQSNLAIAQRWLGAVTRDPAKLREARAGYTACEDLAFETDAPFDWARLQWNIADLALARYQLDPNPDFLVEARAYLARARAFFVDGSDYQTERCDDLSVQIEAAEAAA
ncbi:hypothetical protein K3729_11200 [Rhodobacteraceae bacterium S2214]|nr:hypothetical protein K3729_11200 [Rhodobacteraceae bacterium S2214]